MLSENIPYQVMTTALFAHFQCTDSVLQKLVGPLPTAAPASTVMPAKKDEQVVDSTAGGRNSMMRTRG